MPRAVCRLILLSALGFLNSRAGCAQDNPVTNEYRVTIFTFHPLTENIAGFGNLGYSSNPQGYYETYTLGYPGITYTIKPWLQIWAIVLGIYTDNEGKPDTLELRPYVGPKFFLPNKRKMVIFNWTRYEMRNIYSHGTHDWAFYSRVRSRSGVQIPLTSLANAWKPKTFYGLTDVEPFWQAGSGLTMVRFRAGLAYIPNDRIRIEFIYSTQWGKASGSDSLVYNRNIFRMNIRVGVKRGLLGKVSNPGS